MTPVLSFSEVAITTNVKRLHEVAVQSEHRWAAVLSRLVPIRLLRDLILPITKTASCSKVYDAEHLADAGFETVIFTGRVVDLKSLGRLKCVAQRTQMVVVIDHFRHAELLSQCVAQSGLKIQVLIEVDLGAQATGVRPGPDASLLATATALLPGLSLIGVFASAVDCGVERAGGETHEAMASIVTIAEHALRSIRDVSPECNEMIVAVSSARWLSKLDARIKCLAVSPFLNFNNEKYDAHQQHCVYLNATVISRPSLETCVIDAGRNALDAESDTCVYEPPGASIQHSTFETSTLLISGEAADLRIGDLVRLAVRNPERLLHQVRLS